jgi:hypothetical protein
MKQKMHGEYVRPDPSGAVAYLMKIRGAKPICEDLPRRSSPRVGRVTSSTRMHVHGVPPTYRKRITLPSIWEKKP